MRKGHEQPFRSHTCAAIPPRSLRQLPYIPQDIPQDLLSGLTTYDYDIALGALTPYEYDIGHTSIKYDIGHMSITYDIGVSHTTIGV